MMRSFHVDAILGLMSLQPKEPTSERQRRAANEQLEPLDLSGAQKSAKLGPRFKQQIQSNQAAHLDSNCNSDSNSRCNSVEIASSKNDDEKQTQDPESSVARARARTLFTERQLAALEWRFARNKYLTSADRNKLASTLSLRQVQVKTWFQVSGFV